jgi:5-methylcytosine-specific restriction protein A
MSAKAGDNIARAGSHEMPTFEDFSNELFQIMAEAAKAGNEFVEIQAGELHRRVGGYPGEDHRIPNCCRVMRGQLAIDYGDAVISEPPSGQGASLTIRYRLPRMERMKL